MKYRRDDRLSIDNCACQLLTPSIEDEAELVGNCWSWFVSLQLRDYFSSVLIDTHHMFNV